MNEITKIDTKNGILSEGEMYHSAGFGSEEKSNTAKEALGLKAFCKLNSGVKFNIGMHGACDDIVYYLTTEQAEKWNAHIEEQELLEKPDPLMERAIELAVDGIEILGYGRPEGYEVKEGYEFCLISLNQTELGNYLWCRKLDFTAETQIFFQRKIKEEREPELRTHTPNQLKNYHRDKWLELLTGYKPKAPNGNKNGTLSTVAKALYGKGGAE